MTAIDTTHLLIALLCGIITYGIRISFVARREVVQFSKRSKIVLDHIPTACFSALIVSMLFVGENGLEWDFYQIFACLIAACFGFYFKNLMIVILTGMLSFWFIQFIF